MVKFLICVHIHERAIHSVGTVPWNVLKKPARETPRMANPSTNHKTMRHVPRTGFF
jgi:hypothetical protein